MLGPDGTPLNRRYYSPKSGRDLEDDDLVRGYEVEDDKYVIVTDEELERLTPEKTRDIDLRKFVERKSIAPLYFERSYFLTPGGGSEKAYKLLARTMEDSGRVGIATFVMRGKEYLVAILAENGILRAETLRFEEEIRTPKEIGLPEKNRVPKATLTKFERFITSHSKARASKTAMKDDETGRLLRLVRNKKTNKKNVIHMETEEGGDGKVIDIMDVLKKSIAEKR